MPVLAGATDCHPSAFLVATPTGPVLLIASPLADLEQYEAVDALRAKIPQLPVLLVSMPVTLVGSFDG